MKLPKNIPDKPGIYMLKNKGGQIIYIGKALSLKKRLSSYFKRPASPERKMNALTRQISDYDYLTTDSEEEALILEANLIKEHQPFFNIHLRDDKKYPFIKLSLKDAFPSLRVDRTLKKDGSRYYGPYTDVGSLRKTLKLIRELFLLRSCSRKISAQKSERRPCLNFSLKKCSAPCCGKISKADYKESVRRACLLLEGRVSKLTKKLSAEMDELSKMHRFEEAASIRDKLKLLQKVKESKRAAFYRGARQDFVTLSEMTLPRDTGLTRLKEILGQDSPARLIEGLDISHLGGREAVGSAITFADGKPEKSGYRIYKIKSANKKDDCEMLKEVIRRRYRVQSERQPDLILVDGGRGQLSSAEAALRELGIKNISVISLAKVQEHIFIPGKSAPLCLSRSSSALQLLQNVRDEAHRFASLSHRRLRAKTVLRKK